mmetsp:Transcript_38657/g.109323  ORF Transcript_38657/g.109323 Transcript_38657/m.109323 type:complete len:159 (-) Transcript_38657:1604-2080(-)
MGCAGSKPRVKYCLDDAQKGALGFKSGRQRQWPDGLDRNFNLKRGVNKEWKIFHDEVLGKGAFGVVKKCRRISDGKDGEMCAVKIVPKEKLEGEDDIKGLRLEIDCMNRLGTGSLNCIALYDAFEDEDNVYMVILIASSFAFAFVSFHPNTQGLTPPS